MALQDLIERLPLHASPALTPLSALLLLFATYIIYRSFLDPLSNIPGPLICKLTYLWDWYHSYLGDESKQIDVLHAKYGPVVRIGPKDVVIADGAALAPIYSEKGGFRKAPCYANFDSEGHATIFSALDPKHRAVRSKAVMPMFSTANIRARSDAIEGCIDNMIYRLKQEAEESRRAKKETGVAPPVDVLNLSRGLAIDAVSNYLFGKDYGAISEKSSKMSASTYVDSIVIFGRLFFLPPWLFVPLIMAYERFFPNPEVGASSDKVNSFTNPLAEDCPEHEDTYQSRLLKAGCSVHEADVQMKDVIFAGTDTTGTNLGTILFQLAKHPHSYRELQQEIKAAEQEDPNYNPSNLKYLDAVIREGLRTSLANPTRFPRLVPPTGLTFTANNGCTYHLPPGATVGLSPYTLHFNPKVFSDPTAFKPERWLNGPTPEMYRDFIPFGLGPRQCIARNLASMELTLAVRAVAKSNVLEGARPVKDKLEVYEWFNAKVKGERIDLVWD
ncbi:Cytochrome P450 2U1 [Lecanosticta acicola]|uniref:Cytochrome P450 2U1 n=1 Tax=Lecanosticta acicola TaxID=111012 RepID=A0AAI8YTC0_9PEZI|nr:Cytochrome P450 2U1 [Lecanosticta acicola]